MSFVLQSWVLRRTVKFGFQDQALVFQEVEICHNVSFTVLPIPSNCRENNIMSKTLNFTHLLLADFDRTENVKALSPWKCLFNTCVFTWKPSLREYLFTFTLFHDMKKDERQPGISSTSQTIHIIAIGDQSRLFYEKMLFLGMIHENTNTRFVIWENSKTPYLPLKLALEPYMRRESQVSLSSQGLLYEDIRNVTSLEEIQHIFNIIGFRKKKKIIKGRILYF